MIESTKFPDNSPTDNSPTDAEAVTALVLGVFRLNGALLAAGDALVADLGLTSARWQVLGAVALADPPEPVAGLARRMGLARQSVQRVADDLAAEGLVAFAPNPNHRRARLVVATGEGERVYAAAMARQGPWARALAARFLPGEVAAAAAVVRRLVDALEGTGAAPAPGVPSGSSGARP